MLKFFLFGSKTNSVTATFTRRPAAIRGVSARLVGSILLYCAIRAYHPRTSLVQFDNALYDGGLA